MHKNQSVNKSDSANYKILICTIESNIEYKVEEYNPLPLHDGVKKRIL